MPFPLETNRLVLRHFHDEDLEAFLAYRNDPEVYRYQGWKVPFERSTAREFVESMKMADPYADGQWFQTVLEQKSDHVQIGDVGFFPKRGSHGQAYIGFTLARPYWGKGYATEAVTAVLDFLFRERKLHRIQADCDPDNSASCRLLERLGFRREAVHIESYWSADHWTDEFIYALLEREWTASHSQS
jgi:aminoglycoside 6'-N-acetyltransferase